MQYKSQDHLYYFEVTVPAVCTGEYRRLSHFIDSVDQVHNITVFQN